MLDVFLSHAPEGWRQDSEIERRLLSDIFSQNGKPSIHQMELFCERLQAIGRNSPHRQELLDEYQRALRTTIQERVAAIRLSGSPGDFIICGAKTILQTLHRRGITLIILSGTVEHEVRAEADLLGLSSFFGRHIYGSPSQGPFSKRDVIDRLMSEEKIEGQHLLAFGDGPVEIQFTKAVGGLGIGVASDEDHNGSHKTNPFKREQLIRAGADAIIPDYADADALLAEIFSK